ncbi:polysaccharide lyase [Vibrio breoganii]|uniref:polysaccharide lyase n=1 Tax=Vibrio breoganii TaxID=553239 RepID=UPI0010BDA282|nr:polysaccharide lyase [Vibrio breoganii]TKG24877.1 hypothetical protein FCV87_17735 [Vibrio breoganii]
MLLKTALLVIGILSTPLYAMEDLQCLEKKKKDSTEQSRTSDFSSLEGWGQHFSQAHSAQIVDDPLNENNTALRVTLREGEVYETRSGEHFRAEVYERYKAPFEEPMYYRFKVLIPDEWEFADVRALIAQWHGTPDLHLGEISRSPNLGIELRNDRFLIRSQTSDFAINKHNKQGMNRTQHFHSEPVQRNHWYTFEVQVKWTYQDSGYLRISIDGEEVVNHQGATSYRDCIGPYFKMGIYRDDTPKTFQIYFDDYHRALLSER